MIFPFRLYKKLSVALVVIVLTIIMSATTTTAQIPSISLKVADTTAAPNSLNTAITVFMDNIFDEVAGFNIWIQLDRPDVMIFQTDTITIIDTAFWECIDTNTGGVCIDSIEGFGFDSLWYVFYVDTFVDTVGSFDTTGTLISGWDFVDTRSLSGVGTDINIVGIADLPGGAVVPPISSGQQGGVLLRILADVFPMDDSVSDRTVNMLVQTDFKDHFSFARPDGSSINWTTTQVLDTTCFECLQWFEDTLCLNWNEVPQVLGQPLDTSLCDSLFIELVTIPILDSANINIINGSLTVLLSFACGNINGSLDGQIDIADLVYLVGFMFQSGPDPIPYEAGNVDCAGLIDISDLVYMVGFMFQGGPVPCAACP